MQASARCGTTADVGAKHRGGEVVAILSGKGGVGKTNFALNVSILLAESGRRVILLDAGLGQPNADILLSAVPRATVADVLDPQRDVAELLATGPGGLRVLCARGGGWQGAEFDPQDGLWVMERLRAACDMLVIDCGNTVNPTLTTIAEASTLLVLATTPEPTALAEGYATLKYLQAGGFRGRVGIVVSMTRTVAEAELVARRLARVTAQFLGLSCEYLGHVPLDRHIPLAVRARVPVVVRYPRCRASAAIAQIRAQLEPAHGGRPAVPGVWLRLASLFL
jgi:flagellar biosynthesis protein FlhG